MNHETSSNESTGDTDSRDAHKSDKPRSHNPIPLYTAVVTVLGTIVVAVISNWPSNTSEITVDGTTPKQRYLILHAAKPTYRPPESVLSADATLTGYRLGIDVNGERYSFPTRHPWVADDGQFYPARLPIPHKNEYLLFINGFGRYSDGQEESFPTNRQPVDVIKWVAGGTTRLKWYGNGFEVDYEITE
ncbi:hypothetical protein [Calycomorphotria hydatis]|uniref:Uncharacterized protein n=1 Tax=Calycomorphotria hydatis TaxID=2528027 RepID=A0A517TEU0_9PLAN|nr:hypothetical protein [Calycomorphotria hydatis]QDT66891.1 hypothetical protein V22_41630 [Calycomorphotria hydatis]